MTKDQWRRVIISILVGAVVTAISSIIDLVLNEVKGHILDLSGTASSMIYYLKSRRVG